VQQSIAEGKFDPRLCLLSGLDQCFPDVLFLLLQQQHLDVRAGVLLDPVQSCRDDSGIVDHQQVARLQQVHNVIKMVVAARAACAVHQQQAGVVPWLHRSLCNLLFGQIKPKIRSFHTCIFLHKTGVVVNRVMSRFSSPTDCRTFYCIFLKARCQSFAGKFAAKMRIFIGKSRCTS